MPTTTVFGNRQFIPDEVFSYENVLVVFHKVSNQGLVCSQITMKVTRPTGKITDLASGKAVIVSGFVQGSMVIGGILTVRKNAIDILNAYSTICDPSENDISIYVGNPCEPGRILKITAHGVVVSELAVSIGGEASGITIAFLISGISISDA